MIVKIMQVSSDEKVTDFNTIPELNDSNACVLGNERYSYQIALKTDDRIEARVEVISPIKEYVRVFNVKEVAMDYPVNIDTKDHDFLTCKPGLLPDLLMPIEDQDEYVKFSAPGTLIWVEVMFPGALPEAVYPVTVRVYGNVVYEEEKTFDISATMHIEKVKGVLPEAPIIYTQWFHTDCIATAHHVDIFSEEHWQLIDKYIGMASELGINMLLTPVITPPLDTGIGVLRPCVQLVRISKEGDKYYFDYTLLKRWIDLCKKNHIQYFEMAHLFSQWGAKYAPNIMVNEQGEDKYLFGWHVSSVDQTYIDFLKQFIPSLMNFLTEEEIVECCYFHISDEPRLEDLDRYQYAYRLIKPMIGKCQIIDAASKLEFYEKGLIEVPVVVNDSIEAFLEKKVGQLWTYYCCVQDRLVSNRFMSMPSYRNRIIGIQMYKYGVKGFLHWGYNFYYSQYSRYPINPYVTSSAEKAFPSGDPFSVYPGENGPLPSVRACVFREALQDNALCKLLESYIGREEVIKLIEEEAEMEITFTKYPRNNKFLPGLNRRMKREIKYHNLENGK